MKRTDNSQRVQRSHLISTTAKTFHLPSDLSYTRSAWQKFRHRLGSFPQPAARRDEARRGEAWRGEAGGGGGVREGLFSSQAPIACRRETLINHSNSPSTSGVGLNFPPHLVPYNPHGTLEIFQKLQYGPRAHLRFQQSPTRSRGPIVSSVPITVSIYQCFSEDLLRLSFT